MKNKCSINIIEGLANVAASTSGIISKFATLDTMLQSVTNENPRDIAAIFIAYDSEVDRGTVEELMKKYMADEVEDLSASVNTLVNMEDWARDGQIFLSLEGFTDHIKENIPSYNTNTFGF